MKTKYKLIIDCLMIILLIFAMAFRITDRQAHEAIGISILFLFIVHNTVNIHWYKSIIKRKVNLATVINMLLLLMIVILFSSGLLLFVKRFELITLDDSFFIKQIHTLFAYWVFIFASIHFGLHFKGIASYLKHVLEFKVDKVIVFTYILSIFVIFYGVYESFNRDICAKLIMYYSFDFFDNEKNKLFYILGNISIIALYSFMTYYIIELYKNKLNKIRRK